MLTCGLVFLMWIYFRDNVRINKNSITCIHTQITGNLQRFRESYYTPFSSDANPKGEWCLTASLHQINFVYSMHYKLIHIHCKKERLYLIIPREGEFDIPAGDGKIDHLFLQCMYLILQVPVGLYWPLRGAYRRNPGGLPTIHGKRTCALG